MNYSYWIFVPEVARASWIVGPSVTTLTLWMQNSATHDYCVLHAHSCTHTHKHTHTHWHPITERHEASHLLITGHMYDKQSRWTVACSSLTGKKKSGADGWMVQLIGCCLLFVDEWIPFRKLLFYDYSLKYPKADTLLPDCLSLSASDFDQMDLSHMTALKLNEKHSVPSHQLYLLTSPLTVAWVNFLYGINLNS